jgi:UDP-GlcNAc:undecaprenyl-phosphate GlcNAc-1-phosphate transferase
MTAPPINQSMPLTAQPRGLDMPTGDVAAQLPLGPESMWDVFNDQLIVFIAAFAVTVLITPIMRRIAIGQGIVDRPSEARKAHKLPVAYLGGIAVFAGVLAGIAASYVGLIMPAALFDTHLSAFDLRVVPMSVLLGMAVITITGLIDDVVGLDPRLKIAGQLVAAAALALDNVGVNLARGLLTPLGVLIDKPDLTWTISNLPSIPFITPSGMIVFDLIYWTGTAIIGIFVLGACNASNFIDGLDGLLSGVTAIAAAGLLIVALHLAMADDGPLDAARITLALALLGACLGFLPHNFNPATIFLGDTGSLLLGYLTIVLVLSLGDTGKTHFVIAGLIIYAIPIIDTVLAIVRRKLAGKSVSEADDQHLHHLLKRALGVKGAVLSLYALAGVFALLGVVLTEGRVRVVLTFALVFGAFIGVTAVKIARRAAIEADAARHHHAPATPTAGPPAQHLVEPARSETVAAGAAASGKAPARSDDSEATP